MAVHLLFTRRSQGLGGGVGKRPAMQAEDDRIGKDQVGRRLRTVLALIAWIVVASVTVGSLLYTSLGRFFA